MGWTWPAVVDDSGGRTREGQQLARQSAEAPSVGDFSTCVQVKSRVPRGRRRRPPAQGARPCEHGLVASPESRWGEGPPLFKGL